VRERRLLVLGGGPEQLGLLGAARRRGIVVVCADSDPAAPGFRHASRRALLSLDDESAVDRLARAERLDGVIAPGSDRFLAAAARVAHKLGLPHPLGRETAQAAGARERERELLEAAGVPQPEAVVCHSLAEVQEAASRFGFPCRIDPLDRQAALRPETTDALAAARTSALTDSRSHACLVERVPRAPVLGVHAFVADGALRPLLVVDRAGDGPSWPASAAPEQISTAIQLTARSAAALGVSEGPLTTLVALEDEGALVLRAAPRLGGEHQAELCRAATGTDLNGLALAAAFGLPVAEHDVTPVSRVGGACVRFLHAPAGRLVAVHGVAEAFDESRVRGIRIYHRPGRVLQEHERVGAVLAVGNGVAAAEAAAERAVRSIRLETVRAQAA
jgi:argininosuccinate lyase